MLERSPTFTMAFGPNRAQMLPHGLAYRAALRAA
jgi:hypothetical protein